MRRKRVNLLNWPLMRGGFGRGFHYLAAFSLGLCLQLLFSGFEFLCSAEGKGLGGRHGCFVPSVY